MDMSCDVAHAIVVMSYMDTSSEVAHDTVVTSYMDTCEFAFVMLFCIKYTHFVYVFIEQILKLTDSVTYFRSIGQRHVDRLSYPLVLFCPYLAILIYH